MTWAKTYRTQLVVLAILLAALAAPALPSHAQGGGTHTVQSGENLFRIALRYNTTVEALAAANGIPDPTRIYAGQVLVIPSANTPPTTTGAAAPPAADPVPAAPDPAPVYHAVQRGETLASIGRAYGIGWTDIAAANGLANPNQIYGGQQLLIPGTTAPGSAALAPPVNVQPVPAPAEPANLAPPAANPAPATNTSAGQQRTHVVQRGEHLAQIARAYEISWPTIASANNITDPNTIHAGQTLIIPDSDSAQGAYLQPASWNPPAAAPTITSGKQVVVDLSDQRVYAYENGQLLKTVVVSTGLSQFPTVQGDFRVYLKYESQTMSGEGYYLPGVPYVIYFYQGYSLHGTYWHSNFGQPMSHGCVNMPTPDAQWFYTWTEIGTPVHVQF